MHRLKAEKLDKSKDSKWPESTTTCVLQWRLPMKHASQGEYYSFVAEEGRRGAKIQENDVHIFK